jgi:glycosyl transferase family 25
MTDCPTFLINLDGSDIRLESSRRQFEDANWSFERIVAVDGRGKTPSDFDVYDDAAARRFFGRSMTSGEIGCYLSHIKAAQAVIDSDADMGLVFEDDFRANDGAWAVLRETIASLRGPFSPSWDMVNLARPPSRFSQHSVQLEHSSIHRAFYFPVIATVILWSRPGAQAFLERYPHPVGPVDHVYRRLLTDQGTGLALQPPPFGITGIESDIVGASGGFKPPRLYNGVWRLWKSELARQTHCYLEARRHQGAASKG